LFFFLSCPLFLTLKKIVSSQLQNKTKQNKKIYKRRRGNYQAIEKGKIKYKRMFYEIFSKLCRALLLVL
jgi:hypothetical protein